MRAERMRQIHTARREAMAAESYDLAKLPLAEPAPSSLGALAEQVRQCLAAQSSVPELAGLVLVSPPLAYAPLPQAVIAKEQKAIAKIQ